MRSAVSLSRRYFSSASRSAQAAEQGGHMGVAYTQSVWSYTDRSVRQWPQATSPRTALIMAGSIGVLPWSSTSAKTASRRARNSALSRKSAGRSSPKNARTVLGHAEEGHLAPCPPSVSRNVRIRRASPGSTVRLSTTMSKVTTPMCRGPAPVAVRLAVKTERTRGAGAVLRPCQRTQTSRPPRRGPNPLESKGARLRSAFQQAFPLRARQRP